MFVDEQHVPVELELDEHDATALHFLAFSDHTPIATARLLVDGHVGRLAVLQPYRGQSVGRALLNHIIFTARNHMLKSLFLDAQVSATGFYEKAGFVKQGDVFMDAGIEHLRMYKQL